MATKKQMDALKAQIEQLNAELQAKDEALSACALVSRADMLGVHNAIHKFLSTFDDCEGDFWQSDINRLRKHRERIRERYTLVPPKDEDGREMYYSRKWILKEV